MADFLLEVGLEEVPARMLAAAQAELGTRVSTLLERERLLAAGAVVTTYSTPRRLAVLVQGVAAQQADTEERLTGPAWAIAFKGGVPTPAAQAFAKKAGVGVEQLVPLATPKGEYCSATVARPGRAAAQILLEQLPKELAALNWPKPMYWRPGKPERFVRPVKWLVALLDESIVPVEFAGVTAANVSRGHRVLHGAAPVVLGSPTGYREALLAARVMVDVEARRHTIRKALDRVCRTVPNARWREDVALVDTVCHLTEWPSVVLGSFEPRYLALPEEVLVTVMRDHQKYFAVEDAGHTLLPHFLTVLNTETDERGESTIRTGNERVLRARFNDAQFFWDFDQKIPMVERVALLEKVTFHKDLGNYAQKTGRTAAIADRLATLAARRGVAVDQAALALAVRLSKVDLTTELVKEFTELQGIVGGLYLRHADGSSTGRLAAEAIYWQYLPASMSDPAPPTAEAQLLGLADRVGTIVDMFALGLAPSGSRDPYALRRAANAVIKILAHSGLPLGLGEILQAAQTDAQGVTAVHGFLVERLSYYLRETIQLPADVVSAVLAAESESVADAQARAEALAQVRGTEDLAAIAAAWKRSKNILRQAAEKQLALADEVTREHLLEAAEQDLWQAVETLLPIAERFRAERNYGGALEAIATLRVPVDRFFEECMVLVEDAALRGNRLRLLDRIVHELGRIADFSELSPAAESATAAVASSGAAGGATA
ncbi:glycine--tRNA ligase subunit beta [Acidipila sp. EB88]|uniref:glycine--tRNA ligase subunit beta n=1 Tax=Acidipila sp. EB88 TaxID=2305226 RepID=UPI000F5F5773|nr:glycine--tRNA ligase subunit beta [Acidipila sp. EB88]RRA47193.1 glycine--tRNA ligase subunit beta [Acidipila sp. EB88]